MSWKGYHSYGKSALNLSFDLSGFEEYLSAIQAAGNDIDEACKDAINEALPIIEKDMKEGAARHRKGEGKYGTDAVYDAIETKPAVQEGNYIYGEVGVNTEKHPEAKHAVFQEYGDGHSLCFPDPFIRPAFDNNKASVKAAEKKVLKDRGVSVE